MSKLTKSDHEIVLKVIEAAKELADLMDATREGSYAPDSFTTQPMRAALQLWWLKSMPRAKPDCRLCHGKGEYRSDLELGLVQCGCVESPE